MVYNSYSVKIVGKVTTALSRTVLFRIHYQCRTSVVRTSSLRVGQWNSNTPVTYLPQTRLLSLLNFLCVHLKHLQGMMGVHMGVSPSSIRSPSFCYAKVRSFNIT